MSFVEQGHLGGYIEGGDEATWYPDLWEWLVKVRGVRNVLDIGCGEGHSLKYFRDVLGCDVVGIEGVAQDDEDIIQWDYTEAGLDLAMRLMDRVKYRGREGAPWEFDLCWCAEFVEHVEERYISRYLQHFAMADIVCMTFAEPGQQGYHHVNLQTADYWKGALAAIGYQLDFALTDMTRLRSAANTNPYNHYRRSGLAFTRADQG